MRTRPKSVFIEGKLTKQAYVSCFHAIQFIAKAQLKQERKQQPKGIPDDCRIR